jgi:hypothetical protein
MLSKCNVRHLSQSRPQEPVPLPRQQWLWQARASFEEATVRDGAPMRSPENTYVSFRTRQRLLRVGGSGD